MLRLPVCVLFFVALMTATSLARAEGDIKYAIKVRLVPESHSIVGSETITFTNTTRKPLATVEMHLYLNAFADDGTVFMRESGGRMRGVQSEGRGSIRVTKLRDPGGNDLLAGSNNQLIPGDRTQMRTPLKTPLLVGETTTLHVSFEATLPPGFARSGYHEDFYLVGQFFPKLAKLEDDGRFENFPYHGNGEFYADFADYTLEIEAPKVFVVAGNGSLDRRVRSERSISYFYVANRVLDVVFAAWPSFEESAISIGATVVRVFYPPGYEASVDFQVDVLAEGLRRFSKLYGEYPYDELTVIIPPRGAKGMAGMEYPGFIVTDGPWIGLPLLNYELSTVAAHELGHQWFQSMLASNEVRWPFLDEGLTSWASRDLLEQIPAESAGRICNAYVCPDVVELMRTVMFQMDRSWPPPARQAFQYKSWEYGSVYAMSDFALESISRTYGLPRLRIALRAYSKAARFAHPTPETLQDAFDQTYGPQMYAQVLKPLLFDAPKIDISVTDCRATRQGARHAATAAVRRDGPPLPIDVTWTLASGKRLHRTWTGPSETLAIETDAPVVAVRIDPWNKNLLDPLRSDNACAMDTTAERPLSLLALISGILMQVGVGL